MLTGSKGKHHKYSADYPFQLLSTPADAAQVNLSRDTHFPAGARFITKWESMLHDGFIHQIARHLHGLVLVQLDNLATYNFEPLGQLTNLENLYISAKDRRRVDYDVPEGSESDALLYLGALSKLKTLSLLVGYHSGFIDWKVSKLSRLRGSLTCLELGGAADCLTQLPNLAALRRLSLWYADDAGLQTLTTDIHTLSSLTSLTISNCAIKGCWSLHALAKMPYLQRLDLCSVYVKGSSTEARGLLSLPCSTTELVLEAAPEMVDLEHFAQLPRLAKLQLRRCKLSLFEIPDFQGAFSRLEALDLSKNAFSSMPDGLEQFSNLQILDLSCQLVGFQVSAPMDFVEKMPFLRRIDIHTAAARNSQDTWNSMSLFYIAAARDFALGRSRASGKGGTDILLTSAVSDNRDMNWAWGRSDSAHPGSPRYHDSPRYLPYSPSPSSSLE